MTPSDVVGLLAGTTLCVLAYKGFTTITNQGDDIRDPKKNIARSIIISLAICTVLYLLITLSVESSIGASGAVKARNYALAQAAEPFFGTWGLRITVAIAVIATLSGLLASLYSVTWYFGRRLHRAIAAVADSASEVAAGCYSSRIARPGLGVEFDQNNQTVSG